MQLLKESLGSFKKLTHLYLDECNISPDGLIQLYKALEEDNQLRLLFVRGNSSNISAGRKTSEVNPSNSAS